MRETILCILCRHDLRLVLLAGLLAALVCHHTFRLVGRVQDSQHGLQDVRSLAALTAGGGIWAVQYIAALAFLPGLPAGIDAIHALAALGIAIALCALGVSHCRTNAAAAGAFAAIAIIAVHATMSHTAVTASDDGTLMAASAMALVLSVGAFEIASQQRDPWGRGYAACLLYLALLGFHFTAMTAVHNVTSPPHAHAGAVSVVLAGVTCSSAIAALVATLLCWVNSFFSSAATSVEAGADVQSPSIS
jgi:NO-binding membrane sensor protein with MHYT domain